MGHTVEVTLGTRSAAKQPEALRASLQEQTFCDVNKMTATLSDYCSLTQSLSGTLEEAKRCIEELTEVRRTADTSSLTQEQDESEAKPSLSNTVPSLPSPVRFMSLNLNTIDLKDVCRGSTFTNIGKREIAYYGKVDYRYGRIAHSARDFPENEAIDTIISSIAVELDDVTFNKDNITCLITRYNDGHSSIPYHSDNEIRKGYSQK